MGSNSTGNTNTTHIIVLGAGVIGLTTALRLVQTGYKVVIIARHRPFDRDINYASPWAGGHYRPSPDIDPIGRFEADLARATYEEFKKIAQDVLSGVEFMPGVEYFENPSDAYLSLNDHRYSDIEGFRVLNQSELPSGVNYGTTYKTYSLNPPVYLAWLERQLVLAGVKFEQHSLIQLLDAFAIMKDVSPKILINCSGFGFSDPNVYPTRGQTVIVANPCDRTITQQNADGTWTFIIPRPLNGGTIVGGTKEPNDWNPHVDVASRKNILCRAAQLYPSIITNGLPPDVGGFIVLSDIVGRRATDRAGADGGQNDHPRLWFWG